jgi:drug/metabolite transporter (DMT)-like permease
MKHRLFICNTLAKGWNFMEKTHSKSVVLLIITAILWSAGGVLIKWVSLNPLAIAGYRSLIASVIILIYIRKPRFTWSIWQIGGAVFYAATVIAFVAATKMTTAANAILLQYSAPIYVALISAWLLKERTKMLDWIVIFLVLGGLGLFFLDDLSGGKLEGNILALVSGVTFACLIVFMRKQKSGSPIESVLLGNILTALVAIPFIFREAPDLESLLGVSLLGIFQLGLSYILFSTAIKHVTALEGSLIPIIEPILNPIWVLILLGEVPGLYSLIGGIIVLSVVTLWCILPILRYRKRLDNLHVTLKE